MLSICTTGGYFKKLLENGIKHVYFGSRHRKGLKKENTFTKNSIHQFQRFFFFTKSQLVFQVPFLPVSSGLSLPSALRCCPLPSSFAMLRFQIGNLCAPAKLRPERSWPFHQSPHLSLCCLLSSRLPWPLDPALLSSMEFLVSPHTHLSQFQPLVSSLSAVPQD